MITMINSHYEGAKELAREMLKENRTLFVYDIVQMFMNNGVVFDISDIDNNTLAHYLYAQYGIKYANLRPDSNSIMFIDYKLWQTTEKYKNAEDLPNNADILAGINCTCSRVTPIDWK